MTRPGDDIELFASFHRGDTLAIKRVYELHFKPLCFFAERITGTKEDAEDLVTESFLKMLNQREDFQNLSNVKSFLYLVTKNAAINFIKSRGRQNAAKQQISYLTASGEEIEDAIGDEVTRAQVLQQIHEEIENLPERCRQIFKLLYLQGLSPEEISRQLKISAQTVYTQKARAVQLLKNELLKKNLITALLYLIILFPAERI